MPGGKGLPPAVVAVGDWHAERKTAERAAESRGRAIRDMAMKTLDRREGAFVYAKIGGGAGMVF
jgi:hypothetical protein